MKVFLIGAVSSADEKQLRKYEVYKNIIENTLDDLKLTVPDDIWDYRSKCIKENPNLSKIEIDKKMVEYDLMHIKQSDLLICDLSERSSGMGIELGVAYSNAVKVIFFYEKGSQVSNMVTGAFSESDFVMYSDVEDLQNKLKEKLTQINKN